MVKIAQCAVKLDCESEHLRILLNNHAKLWITITLIFAAWLAIVVVEFIAVMASMQSLIVLAFLAQPASTTCFASEDEAIGLTAVLLVLSVLDHASVCGIWSRPCTRLEIYDITWCCWTRARQATRRYTRYRRLEC